MDLETLALEKQIAYYPVRTSKALMDYAGSTTETAASSVILSTTIASSVKGAAIMNETIVPADANITVTPSLPFFGDPRDIPYNCATQYLNYLKRMASLVAPSHALNLSRNLPPKSEVITFSSWFKYFKRPPNSALISSKISGYKPLKMNDEGASSNQMDAYTRLSGEHCASIISPNVLNNQKRFPNLADSFYLQTTPDYSTLMVVELLMDCKEHGGSPNPTVDEIRAIIYILRDQRYQIRFLDSVKSQSSSEGTKNASADAYVYDVEGAIVVASSRADFTAISPTVDIDTVKSEVDCLTAFLSLCSRFDPTIIVGFDTDTDSIGYILKRAYYLNIPNYYPSLSRANLTQGSWNPHVKSKSSPQTNRFNGFRLEGRLIFSLSQLLRKDLKAKSYRFEGLVRHLLGYTIPSYSMYILSEWWHCKRGGIVSNLIFPLRYLALRHLILRAQLVLKLLDTSALLNRSGELARLYGMDIWSVLTRGSQFRVESLLLRSAHKLGFLLLSPTKQQVTQQAAHLCLPMVMEPYSGFYWSPVVVLDFQSLYPSIIIAYNICYSTCIGTIQALQTSLSEKKSKFPFGVFEMDASSSSIREICKRYHENNTIQCLSALFANGMAEHPFDPTFNGISVLPNETLFVSRFVRCGVLPQLLHEILQTRIMVKEAMRYVLDDELEQLTMQHRQYGLKMIANFAYGYTSASFSGRMPCAEIADAIVQTARKTLERAIKTVEAHPTWSARVLYGDTDSLFVHLEGRTIEDAFRIGKEIATVITKQNPYPVELKMEKVYCPGCLVSKKRYVGMAFTSPDASPYFDAKGIETIRSDQCLLTSTVMEKALHLLFRTKDLSILKAYLLRQWRKVLNDKVIINDYIIAHQNASGTQYEQTDT